MLELCKRCFYTIKANYIGSLEAVDCDIHSVRYDMVRESCWRPSQFGPHQVTVVSVSNSYVRDYWREGPKHQTAHCSSAMTGGDW
eukprot:scaffold2226_cov93-Skeletonema_dohrnii-CCMP3373.AAC.2